MPISVNEVGQVKATGHVNAVGRFIPVTLWRLLPRRGPALVHRLDGVAQLIRGFPSAADKLAPAINRLSDYTIFQSVYSRDSFAEFGVRPERFRIIYNGVDPRIFYPASSASKRYLGPTLRLIAVSWSPNPRKGFATLARISKLPGVEVRFVGRWPAEIDPGNVKRLGALTSPEVAEAMRASDAMIHAAENEPCSNAILEALACGLPVLYKASGGNPEIAGPYGIALTEDLAANVEELRVRYNVLREKILDNRHEFLITKAATQYLEVFEEALELSRRGNEQA